MSDKAKKEKVSDARIFYIGLIAAVAVVQIVLKVFTTLVPDAQSQVFSRITEGIMLIFAVMFALRTTFVQPWFGLKITVCMSRIFRVVVPVSVQNVSVIGVARFIISFPSLSAYFIAVYAPPLCFSTQHRRSCACSTIHSFRFLIAAFG